jgi:hypothetical protein
MSANRRHNSPSIDIYNSSSSLPLGFTARSCQAL